MKKTLLALALALGGAAHAHFVWLEPATGGEAKAYFGEWADDLRETEAGHLKLVSAPAAVAADGTLPTPWPGQYVVEVNHTDKDAGGEWDGKRYTQTRHVATLSFIVQ